MAKNTALSLRTVNLEQGKPTAEQAIARMNQAVFSAKASGTKVIKLIHGYGSSGKGGVIRARVYAELEARKAAGIVSDYIPGDAFSPFSPAGRKALSVMAELSRDRDYSRGNLGITLVLF